MYHETRTASTYQIVFRPFVGSQTQDVPCGEKPLPTSEHDVRSVAIGAAMTYAVEMPRVNYTLPLHQEQEVGPMPDRRELWGDRLVDIAEVIEGVAKVFAGAGFRGIETYSFPELNDRLAQLSLANQSAGEVAVGLGEVGLEAD